MQINSDVAQTFSLGKDSNSSKTDKIETSSGKNCCPVPAIQILGDR